MIYQFDAHSLDADRLELRRGTDLVAVEPQVLDLLQYLIRNRERVVSKDDLIAHVWNGRIVSDSTLSSRITAVRQAIGDNGDEQRLIRTVARKGLRFVGEVAELPAGHANAANPISTPTPDVRPAPKLPDKPSIAVLPFINMSGDPEQEYFSDGITEDIITALSRLRWFFVIARNSTFAYKGQPVDVRQIGRDLGVRYLLEGSVRKSGERVRISAKLSDATTGNHIWAERYDRELTDFFALQDEITTNVTAAIEPKLVAAEGIRAENRSAQDLDAWDLVARAIPDFWKFNATSSNAAVATLRKAVQAHPNYAPAHSMLSLALIMSAYVGWTGGEEREFAITHARRAMELDDGDPWAHLALGYIAMTGFKPEEAIRHFDAALDLNPNFAVAKGSIGWAHAFMGQSSEAIRHFEETARMNPREPFAGVFFAPIGAAYYMAGQYHDAIKWARQSVEARPGYLGAHRILVASLAQAGRVEEARVALDTLRQLHPSLSIAWVRTSVAFAEKPMEKFLDGLRKAGLTE